MKCLTVEEQSACILVTVDPHRGFRVHPEGADLTTQHRPASLTVEVQEDLEKTIRPLSRKKTVCIDADAIIAYLDISGAAFLPVICMLSSCFALMGFCVAVLNPQICFGCFIVVTPKSETTTGEIVTPRQHEMFLSERR